MDAIATVTFLVHPYCYAASRGVPEGWARPRWHAYHERERAVAERWRARIDGAGPEELVVYHPCFESAEERELAGRGAARLGCRWLRLGSRERLYTSAALAALAPGIEAAFAARGKYAWCVHDLRIAAFSWHYARDLEAHLAASGLAFAAGRLRLRAVGESFEGCATTWTTMVPAYLGTPARVEIDYEETVPDTEFLLGCQYLGRTALAADTALYLFVDGQGRPIAHYKRERVELADGSHTATVAGDPAALCVRDGRGEMLMAEGGQRRAGATADQARATEGGVALMVTTGRRYHAEGAGTWPREAPLFLVGAPGDVDGFCERARTARLTTGAEA